jgi:hypothetical protein
LNDESIEARLRLLKPRNAVDYPFLEFRRKRIPQSLRVDLLSVQPFPLEDDGVALLVGETHHLVFEGGTVTGADPFDDPGIEGGETDVLADETVGLFPRRREEGGKALLAQSFRGEGEGFRIGIAVLTDEAGKVDRGGAQARGCSRLHPPHLETERPERGGQFQGGDLASPARRPADVADVDEAAEEGPRGDDHRPPGVKDARLIDHAADPPVFDDELLHQALTEMEAFLLLHDRLHGKAVDLLVALEAGRLDGRAFGGVQEAEMDGSFVGYPPHLPAQGVEFLDELALGEAADRGVAGHQRNGVEVYVEQERLTTHPRRREGRFAARVPAPDDDDVIFPVHAAYPPSPSPHFVPCSSSGNLI